MVYRSTGWRGAIRTVRGSPDGGAGATGPENLPDAEWRTRPIALRRPTFAASLVEAWGWLLSPLFVRKPALPGHAAVVAFLAENGVYARSLDAVALARRAGCLHASASSSNSF